MTIPAAQRPAGVVPVAARVATAVVFLCIGMVFGTWVSRVPEIKDQIRSGTGPLGAALLGIAVGAILARPPCGRLVHRWGSRVVARGAAAGCCLALVLPTLARNAVELGIALTVLGAMLGSIDIAMNTQAVAVEAAYGRPVMSAFHGVYSIGGLLGAVLGGRAAAVGLSPLQQYALAALVLGALAAAATLWMLPPAAVPPASGPGPHRAARVRLDPRYRLPLLLIGLVGLFSLAGEGAVGDWGAIYLHENLGAGVAVASSGFAVYSLAMVTGRLAGDRFVARYGEWAVIMSASAVGGLGFMAALLANHPAAAIGGFIVLGLGLSLVVPVTFSLAGRLGGASASAGVILVSSISGLGPILLPPIIGFLAEVVGLPAALGTISLLALAGVVLMRVIRGLLRRAEAAEPHVAATDR
jgi:fucose permease